MAISTCTHCSTQVRHDSKTGLCREHLRLARLGQKKQSIHADDLEQRRVRRDPCTYCGVRGDVGCRHQRIAA